MNQTTKIIFSIIPIMIVLGYSQAGNHQEEVVKVMSYNIWNGFDWGRDSLRKEKCIQWIREKKPDVLALQELCGYDEDMLKEDALKWGHQYVLLLKHEGYPTALTSNKPIKLLERRIESFWHGMLHCQTYGIDFYVVHLSPADCVFRLQEAKMITQSIEEDSIDKYIILGDFNALSPFDAHLLEGNNTLKEKYAPKNKEEKYSNLRSGNFDYAVIGEFLAFPVVDIGIKNLFSDNKGYTFPTPALIGKYDNTATSIKQNRTRIDYIFASPNLAGYCTNMETFNQKETHGLSDHYPIMAEFSLSSE